MRIKLGEVMSLLSLNKLLSFGERRVMCSWSKIVIQTALHCAFSCPSFITLFDSKKILAFKAAAAPYSQARIAQHHRAQRPSIPTRLHWHFESSLISLSHHRFFCIGLKCFSSIRQISFCKHLNLLPAIQTMLLRS